MIEIVPYDPAWPLDFAALRDRLSVPLSGLASRIEHVGSTAVPGLAAKPVIDVTVVMESVDHLPAVISRLAPLGYRHLGGALGGLHHPSRRPGPSPLRLGRRSPPPAREPRLPRLPAHPSRHRPGLRRAQVLPRRPLP